MNIRTYFLKQSLTMDCEPCTRRQQELLEDGNGLQAICTHLDEKEKETEYNGISKKGSNSCRLNILIKNYRKLNQRK